MISKIWNKENKQGYRRWRDDGEVAKEFLCCRSEKNIYEEKIFDLEVKE